MYGSSATQFIITTMSGFLLGHPFLTFLTCCLTVFVVWLLARLLFRSGVKEERSPPGPRPWPIIGNLNLIGLVPHKSFHKLSETYGPLMQLKFGSSDVIVTNSPDMAKEFLKTHDRIFASRPKLSAGKYTSYNYSNVAWSSGPHWVAGRKIFHTNLFTPERLESYESIRFEEVKAFLKRLHVLQGKNVNLRDHLCHLNVSLMSKVVLGKKFFSENSENNSAVTINELLEMFDELFLLNGVFVVGDWIPWLAWLDLQGYVNRLKILSKKIDKMLDAVIEEHINARTARNGVEIGEVKDMLDVLMDLVDDRNFEVKLTTSNIKGFTMDLVAGGTDTTAATVEWAMADLIQNPKKMEKAKEELDMIIGQERWLEEKDIPNLPYLDAIMKESMRLHPTGALLPPHMAVKDCRIKQYHIPKGTIVLINTWSMGRNETLWDSPNEFRPERFLNKNVDVKGHHFELLPFGSGRRMCPGYSLGLKMVKLSLGNLIHGFQWSLPFGMKPSDLDMDDTFGLTTKRKNPIVVIPEPRLPCHLYTGP